MFAIEHIEHCSLNSLSNTSNTSNIVRLTRCRTCRTLFVCQVIKHASSRASCYILCCNLYTWLFRAKLVTLSLFLKIFVLKVKRSSYYVLLATKSSSCCIRNRTLRYTSRYCLRTLLSLWLFLYCHERLLVSFKVFEMCLCEQVVRKHVIIFSWSQ